MSKLNTRTLAILAMLSALAYVIMFFSQTLLPPIVPMIPLRYDPKDIIIIIGGFLYGPLAVVAMSVTVSFIEMLTVSPTWLYGLVMNVVATCSFALPAAVIYKKKRTITGAVIGLAVGLVIMVATMMLWNYIITPIFLVATLDWAREAGTAEMRRQVAGMLASVFLPFNLLKGGMNAALIMLIYKPVTIALRKTGMLPEADQKGKANPGVLLASLFAVVTCVLLTLVFMGVI